MTVFKEDGNDHSESERLMIVVIRANRESIHKFRSFVGIRCRKHVASEDVRIALQTSRVVAGRNSERWGQTAVGGGFKS
jgi:hypothetical protein